MKNKNERNKRISTRVSEEEKVMIESKAKNANTNVSDYIRETALKGKIEPLTNGKDIAHAIRNCHFELQNFERDIIARINKLTTALDKNSSFIEKNSCLQDTELLKTLHMQRERIETVIDEIHDSCKQVTRYVQDKAHSYCNNLF